MKLILNAYHFSGAVLTVALTACGTHATLPTDPALPAGVYQDRVIAAPPMNDVRATHSATLLANGQVLIAGGFHADGTREQPIATAELYDPAKNSFTPAEPMREARSGHTATRLPSGMVLVVGGWGQGERSATAELYDPATGQWRFIGRMAKPRAGMTATLLKDGRVIIIGGESARGTLQGMAEIYDPTTETFTPAGQLIEGRSAHTATMLPDGRVLVAGGVGGELGGQMTGADEVLSSAEIYEPNQQRFRKVGAMAVPRYKHAAVLLGSAHVLLIGGSNRHDWRGQYRSAEQFDVQTEQFQPISDLGAERFKLADGVIALSDGNILVGGGNRQLERYLKSAARFVGSAQLDTSRYYTILTLLKDGRVLITGGYNAAIQPTRQAWLYS